MKKRDWFWILIIILITSTFFFGCTTKLPYMKDIPLEQQATLIIPPGYAVRNFSGTKVRWDAEFVFKKTVPIPSGLQTISLFYKTNTWAATWNDVEFIFEAGKTYRLNHNIVNNMATLLIEEVAE